MLPSTELILFLNNDVDLAHDALEEMARWIEQPRIGLVGAKLYYPNGSVQHGGIKLNLEKHGGRTMRWEHVDGRAPVNRQGFSQITGICEAVTGACILMKRDLFLGGRRIRRNLVPHRL